jgi:hypothetical protein
MHTLTPNEKKLVTVIGMLIFGIVNIIGLSTAKDKSTQEAQKLKVQNMTRLDSNTILQEEKKWTDYRQWIDANQPTITSPEDGQRALNNYLESVAKAHKVTLSQPAIGGLTKQPYYQEISVGLQAQGTLQNVVQWIADLQQPTNFQAITSVTLKANDKDPAKVTCNLQLARWYSLNPPKK